MCDCNHKGNGQPGCPAHACREQHEGGPQPDTIEGLRSTLEAERSVSGSLRETLAEISAPQRLHWAQGEAGELELFVTPSPTLARFMVDALTVVLEATSEAKNYIETKVSYFAIPRGEEGERRLIPAVLTIQRLSGETPHELRRRAEQQRDEAQAKLTEALLRIEALESATGGSR